MTLPEIAAYLEGWQANRKQQAQYFGTLTAAIYNTVPAGRKKRKPLKWDDIYRTDRRAQSTSEKWEELKRIFPPQKNFEK